MRALSLSLSARTNEIPEYFFFLPFSAVYIYFIQQPTHQCFQPFSVVCGISLLSALRNYQGSVKRIISHLNAEKLFLTLALGTSETRF